MREPFLSQFRELVRKGVSSQDIHDVEHAVGMAACSNPTEAYVDREVERVASHRRALLPLLERFAGVTAKVLDVGCNTGGTTVALAMSDVLRPTEVVGVDPNRLALMAAELRAAGSDLPPGQVRFKAIQPDGHLPFADGSFDLTTCVSVLEFVSRQTTRNVLTSELQRVTRPGGFIFIATPSPWRLRELHSGRLFGHFVRREGYPWSSTPADVKRMFGGCEQVALESFVVRDVLRRRRVPAEPLVSYLAPVLNACLPWQKFLFLKPHPVATNAASA